MSQETAHSRNAQIPTSINLNGKPKNCLKHLQTSAAEAVAEVTAHGRNADPETFALHDAQFVLARSYGFESWPKLKAAVDGVTAA